MNKQLERLAASTIRRAIGPTILLGSGTYFDYSDPHNSEITIDDVAFGLAYEGRFAGQCVSQILGRRVFYSVAEHCTRMSHLVPPGHEYAALMHEAGEPVCGDMVGPLKSLVPAYKAIEKDCENAIQLRFGVQITDPDLIKLYDIRMWATERRDLLAWNGEPWTDEGRAEPFGIEIVPWSPDAAAHAFLNRFMETAPANILSQSFARSDYV